MKEKLQKRHAKYMSDCEIEKMLSTFDEEKTYAEQSAARAVRRKKAEESGSAALLRMKMRLAKTLYDVGKINQIFD